MAKTTLTSISTALDLIDIKKENLRLAFQQLQSHSLLPLSLSWPDLDSHFSSIQSSLTLQLHLLQSQSQSQFHSQSQSQVNPPICNSSLNQPNLLGEVNALCERMDGKGLKNFLADNPTKRNSIREGLKEALKLSKDPSSMILDAVESFHSESFSNDRSNKAIELSGAKRDCVMLLEELMSVVKVEEISDQVKGKAKDVAMAWKGKVSENEGDNRILDVLGFLNLVACYGLAGDFSAQDIVELVVNVAKNRQAMILCRALKIEDRIPDVIQKLVSMGKQLLAVKFIFEFGLSDKFPPVPMLKDHVNNAKRTAKEIRTKGNHSLRSLNEAAFTEINALKLVIKCIEDHNLQSEYPREILEKHIETIEKNKKVRKRPETTPIEKLPQTKQLKLQQPPKRQHQPQKKKSKAHKEQAKQQQLVGSKHPQTTAPNTARANPNSGSLVNMHAAPYQPSHHQATGLLLDQPIQYVGSSGVTYGLTNSTTTFTPYPDSTGMVAAYGGSSVGPYGVAGAPLGFPANRSSTPPRVYSSETHVLPAYYSRPTAYGEYRLPPQFHPSYYPH